MKKVILSLAAIVAFAIPVMASMPSDGYGAELKERNKVASTIKPQYEINVGYITGGKIHRKVFGAIDTNFARPYIDAVVSARLSDYVSLGVGVGLQYAYDECRLSNLSTDAFPKTWGALCVPIYCNVKGYYPVSDLIAPYISLSMGGDVVAASNFVHDGYGKVKGGLMLKFGAGISVSKFHLGLGLSTQNIKWLSPLGATNFKGDSLAFYIETGVMF